MGRWALDIGANQRLLGKIDIEPLQRRISQQTEETWAEQKLRQQNYEVHRDTQSIVLLFCDEDWPLSGEIYKDTGYDRLADVAEPLMAQIINAAYDKGGLIIRAMAARLKPGGKIPAHRDSIHSFHISHRIHVPITSNAGVRFTVGGKPYIFEPGYAYEINNQRKHSVMNLGNEDRITFIFDYVPPIELQTGL